MKKHWKRITPILLLLLSTLIAIPFLTSCGGDGGIKIPGVNEGEIINLIFPQPYVFAAQIIATIILFFVITKFVWKPYNEMIDKRKQFVMQEMKEVEEAKKTIFEEENKIKMQYITTQEKVSEMIESATQQSNTIISDSKQEAKNATALAYKDAQEEVVRLKLKMQKELSDKNISLVMAATEELTMKNINDKDNEKFVEDFLNKLDKEL